MQHTVASTVLRNQSIQQDLKEYSIPSSGFGFVVASCQIKNNQSPSQAAAHTARSAAKEPSHCRDTRGSRNTCCRGVQQRQGGRNRALKHSPSTLATAMCVNTVCGNLGRAVVYPSPPVRAVCAGMLAVQQQFRQACSTCSTVKVPAGPPVKAAAVHHLHLAGTYSKQPDQQQPTRAAAAAVGGARRHTAAAAAADV